MRSIETGSISATSAHPERIVASLNVQMSWKDSKSGEKVVVKGMSECVGKSSVIVRADRLPNIDDRVFIKLSNGTTPIIDAEAEVFRIDRDLAKPKVSLVILNDVESWSEIALTAAQEWVMEDIRLNYDDQWSN